MPIKPTSYAFLLAFIGIVLFPGLHLLYFAPYLILCFYKYSRFASLWRAIGCGVLIDVFSSNPHFGITSLNYCIVSWILYGQTRHFFEDKLSTLPLMTFLFAFFSTLATTIIFFSFSIPIALSVKWLFSDLILMSCFDALCSLLISIPFQITYKLRKVMGARRRAQ